MFRTTKFMDIMKLFPKDNFNKIVKAYQGDRGAKQFNCFSLLISLMYGQISGHSSLREIEQGLNTFQNSHYHLGIKNIHRSTLSDWNNRTNPDIFKDIFQVLLLQFKPRIRKKLGKKVELIDSSPIRLDAKCYDFWALATKCDLYKGMKLHIGYHPDLEVPMRAEIGNANLNDISVSKHWEIESDHLYVFDKGYTDYNWWYAIDQKGARFVTRLKVNAATKVLEKHQVEGNNIIADETVYLSNRSPRGGSINNYYKQPLRRITIAREGHPSPLVLISNCHDLSAKDIADLYKERWQVELFFKKIKQNLKIKRFCGTTRNAVMNQIYTALIVYLLLSLYNRLAHIEKISFHMAMVELKGSLFAHNENYYNKRRRLQNQNQTALQMEFSL